MAVRRGKSDPLIDEVAFCARLGWTWTDLMKQPVWFVERMATYLQTMDEKMERDREKQERDLKERLNRL